jgi:hypothetical protein
MANTTMAGQSEIHDFTGAWINWSHAAIRGAAINLCQGYAVLLVAFLAIYVSFVGGVFWKFVILILNQIYVTESGRMRERLHPQVTLAVPPLPQYSGGGCT